MYKNFPNTHYQLAGSKYFLDNIQRISDSEKVNLRELHFNIESYFFFIKAVGSTFHQEVKDIQRKLQFPEDEMKKDKISRLVEEYKKIVDEDKAIKFIFEERHKAKSQRIAPEIAISFTENIKNETVMSDITMLISPSTGQPLEFLEARDIEKHEFKEWDGNENVLQLCERVYGRIEILAINAIQEINNVIDN